MKKKQYTLKSYVGMALQYQRKERDENRYWDIITKLHFWATPEIVRTGKKLYQSSNWHKRLLAVNDF